MANSTTNLDLISSSQASKEVTANAIFDAASPATLFGRRASTTAALTWGYYGGELVLGGTITAIANGTVTLTASATNYVEATTAGVVSVNTTAFTAGRIPLYTIVTGTATVTSYTDQRGLLFGAQAGVAGGLATLDGSGLVPVAQIPNIPAALLSITARNVTGATIPAMSVVYVTGANSQNPTIALAQANSAVTSSKTIGITTAAIPASSNGSVALAGTLTGMNTSAFLDGDTLWLSATVAGGMTSTRPAAPNHAVLIGFCAYSNTSQGKLLISVNDGLALGELHDVVSTTPTNGQMLVYQSATSTWINSGSATITGGTISGITSLGVSGNQTISGRILQGGITDDGVNGVQAQSFRTVNQSIVGGTLYLGTSTFTIEGPQTTGSTFGVASGFAGNPFIFYVGQFGVSATQIATVSLTGLAVVGAVSATTTSSTGVYTVATLPAGAQSMRATVTDAVAPTFLGALTGGGTVVCPVFHNGTAWVAG